MEQKSFVFRVENIKHHEGSSEARVTFNLNDVAESGKKWVERYQPVQFSLGFPLEYVAENLRAGQMVTFVLAGEATLPERKGK